MSWTARTKMTLASIIFRHRVLNRWAHRHLPKKRMAAGVMLFDESDRLLMVKPSYRQDWLVPGGVIENNEAPWAAARRETLEEIRLEIDQLRLVAIDWRSTDDEYDDSLHFLFDGGTLSADQQSAIQCDGIEIVDYRFATRPEAEAMLDPHLMRRVMPCWQDGLDRPLMMNRGELDQQTSAAGARGL